MHALLHSIPPTLQQATTDPHLHCILLELPDVQAEFRKGRGMRDQIANICWIIEKAREFQKKKKKSSSALLAMPKLLCGSQQTVKNSSRHGNTRPPDLHLEKSVRQLRKQQLELDMEQQTGSK